MRRGVLAAALAAALACGAETIELRSLDISSMSCGDGRTTLDGNVYGHPIVVGGKTYPKGVGTHAPSRYELDVVGGEALSFSASVGLGDNYDFATQGSITFRVYADGKVVAESPVCRRDEAPRPFTANLKGARTVALVVTDAGDGIRNDLAAWIDARFEVTDGTRLKPIDVTKAEQLGILTPRAPEAPRINPPRIFGVRPGHPILFTLPVSGVRPMRYSAKGLPEGAKFDAATGRLSGAVVRPGRYELVFTAENAKGSGTRAFTLVVGEKIALTPPMGWNSWNCFASDVSEARIRSAAKAFAESGLMDYGWSYVNIDDYWQNTTNDLENVKDIIGPFRTADGSVAVNRRFGDMKGLADYVHSLGLKIGLYSSPGPHTCGRCAGSWMHERQDAEQYAAWGFDYLKYDWCSYGGVAPGSGLKRLMAPYQLMGRELARLGRDIVYSICQYGWGNVSTWGASVGGQCWRTTDDICDNWGHMIAIAGQQDGLEHFAGPGAWNDADMLIVGWVGWGPALHPTRLTRNEQYTHMTLWSLIASPLLIGCDLTRLDDFTRALLTNPEVLEVSQDVLGKAASRIRCDGWNEGAWVRPLADGSVALGLINLSSKPRRVTVDLEKDLGLVGEWKVRDLWRMADEGTVRGGFGADILVHAAKFVKLTPQKGAGLAPGVADCRERSWRRLYDGRTERGARPCGCATPVPAPARVAAKATVDFTRETGRIRPALHSAGWTPRSSLRSMENDDEAVKAMNLKYARTHDWALVNAGQRVVDYQCVFPLFDKDAKDPSNYYFDATDHLLGLSRAAGLEPFYRLGTSIEHSGTVHFNALVPTDYAKTAEIFAGIIRHYNRGWANGKEWNIRYWEIWNEPDLFDAMWWLRDTPTTDLKTLSEKQLDAMRLRHREAFVPFFVTVLKRLKDEFPELRIGGPALTHMDEVYFTDLLKACKAAGVAPDFISWHYYGQNPDEMTSAAEKARRLCDGLGFTACELILNEWHYIQSWEGVQSKNATPEEVRKAHEGPAGVSNIDSACFTLSSLIKFQSSKLDMANFYGCAHTGNWGYLDNYKQLNKVGHALRLFGGVVRDYPVICASESSAPAVTTLAVRSADGRRRALLVSDYRGEKGTLEIAVKGAEGAKGVSSVLLDHTHNAVPCAAEWKDGTLKLTKADGNSAAYLITFED